MRTIPHIAISAFLAMGLFAAEPGGSASKHAWNWSDDERIATRLDSVSVRERLRIYREEESRGVSSTSRIVDNATFVIDGQRNPELFLPWELMERFLNRVPPGREATAAIRARLEGRIRSSGWSPDAFWREIDAGAADYFEQYRRAAVSNVPAPAAEVAESLPDPVELRNRYCRARTHALDHAHAALGQRGFDRFLYEVIAPGVVLLSDVPMTADELRVAAGGCDELYFVADLH